MAGADQQDRFACPPLRLGAHIRDVADDSGRGRSLAGGGDPALPERVGDAIGAGTVEGRRSLFDVLLPVLGAQHQPERSRGPLGRADLLVLEQPFASHRENARAGAKVRRDALEPGQGIE